MNNEKSIKIKISREPLEKKSISEESFKERFLNNPWEKIAKVSLYLLIFLTPLFFLPLTINPIEINKQMLALILVFIAFLCYLIRSINSRTIIYPRNLLSLAVLILLIVTGISTIFSQAREASFFGNFSQIDTLLCFLIYGLTFFLAAVLFKKEDLPKIGLCFLGSFVLLTIFGLLQVFGRFILPLSFTHFVNFNPIGSIFGWGIFIAFGLVIIISVLTSLKLPIIFSAKDASQRLVNLGLRLSLNWKIILSFAGFLAAVTLFLLNYQLLWIGLALTMFLLLISRFDAKVNINLPLIILAVSLFFIFVNQQLPALITVPVELRPNLNTTLTVAKEVLAGKQLLAGSGPATFGFSYVRFRPVDLNQTIFWPIRFNQGFSFLATLLSTLGILGIGAFIFLFASFILRALKGWEDKRDLSIFIGVSFLFINWFFYQTSFSQMVFVFLGLGLLSIDSSQSFSMEFHSPSKWRNARSFLVFLGIIILLSFSLFFLYLTSLKYAAAVYYETGINSASLAQAVSRLEKSVRLDSKSDLYLRALSQARLSQAKELIQAAANQQNTQDIQSRFQNLIAFAVNTGRRATEINPIDAVNWSNLGNIYESIIPIEQAEVFAEENYRKAMEFDPKNPQYFVDLARVSVVSADQESNKSKENKDWQEKLDKAKSFLDKSIELKSDYAPAHFLIAQIYMRQGEIKKAIGKVEEIKAANPNDAGLAFQLGLLYYQNNQLTEAQGEFERAISLNENYSNARYFLGLILSQKGQKKAAIEQFENIEKLNPDNQEIKKILNNLRSGKAALEGVVPPAQPPAERIETPVSEKEKTTTP